MIHKVLVIGATGMLGKPVTEELHHAGFEVRVLVRDIEKARRILPSDIELFRGELQDEQAIRNAITGMDAVYLNLSVAPTEKRNDFHTEKDGLRKVIIAARQEGIQRIAYLSSLVQEHATDWWVFDIKRDAIRQLKESRIPITIFYPSNFMETIPGQFRAGKRLLLAGKPLYDLWWIAAHDYGKQVAKALQIDEGNHHYVIQGPEAVAQERALEIFVRNYQKESLTITKVPMWVLKFAGLFSRQANYGANIIDSINHYPETFRAEESWKRLGKPATRLEDFARSLSAE